MDSLVSTEWLADNLGAPDLAIIDASLHLPSAKRDARDEYETAHIPGAQFLDLASLVDKGSLTPQAMPTGGQLAERLASLGISKDTRIVFYDDSQVKSAARAWVLARAYGFQDVSILDGGLAKWKAESRELESGYPTAERGDLTLPDEPTGIRTKAEMLINVGTYEEQVVDARDTGRFNGEILDHVHNLPGGHIPGACNLPFTQLFEQDGTFRDADAIRREFLSVGIDPERPVIASCGSGVTASVLLFALHLIGKSDGALYDGSWLEWGADPETPKAIGPNA